MANDDLIAGTSNMTTVGDNHTQDEARTKEHAVVDAVADVAATAPLRSSGSNLSEQPPKREHEFNLSFSWYRLIAYDLFLWLFSVIFDCFFREIRSRGAFRLPRSGPVIFVAAPHANQFVDPLILMNQVKRESQRRISFLIAAKSYKQRLIGFLSRCQLSIPVVRAQDLLNKGTGKIFVDFDEDPLLVKGVKTKFLSECTVKGLLALPQSLGASEIMEVRSDTELVIRKEFKSTDKIKKLLRDGTSFKKADKVDQKHVYKLVFDHLSNGNCIGIFPEGGSHDRTDLLPLKAGVAIMALGAMNNDPNCKVKIVPCGMNYFNAHKFRSRAVIEFGHPIEVPMDLVEKYSNPDTNRDAVKDLLAIITQGLKAVTVTCEDFETLMVVQAARRLYAGNFAQYLPLPLIVEMNRRLVMGYQTFKDDPKVQELKEKILKYNAMLKQLYLPDHHVEDCDESHKLRLLPVLLFRIAKLFFLLVLSLPGATLFSPVFLSAKLFSNKKAREALANSIVKIKANDVIATWKILVGMVIAPLVYSFYATIVTWYCYHYQIFSHLANYLWSWLSLYMLGVMVTYAALLTGEQGVDLFKSIRPLYLSLTSGSSIRELKKFRNELSEEITYLVNLFGPELFPNDFNLLESNDILNDKKTTSINGKQQYLDSDEEEELKTQELRKRRMAKRKERKQKAANGNLSPSNSELSLNKRSSSVSDGISLMNSDNSLTDIPMFSDYHLHMNAKNSSAFLSQLSSAVQSSNSIADDFNFRSASHSNSQAGRFPGTSSPNPPSLSRSGSETQIEFNFGAHKKSSKLSEKIKQRVREGRGNKD